MASSFDHPERGRVECPSAPLIAAWLDTWGMPNTTGPLTGTRRTTARTADRHGGQLVATTYTDTGGRAVGIAVLAPPLLVETAVQAVSTWSACLRTRRLLVPRLTPHCEPALTALFEPGTPNAPTPAATTDDCRHRASTRQTALDHRKDRRTVLVVGAPPGEAGASAPASAEGMLLVPDVETAVRLRVPDPRNLALVVAPCADTRGADRIIAALGERFPLLEGQHPGQWCHRSTDNRQAVQAAVGNSDLALFLPGAPPVPPRARNTLRVRTLADLRPADLAPATTIALLGPPASPPSPTAAEVAGMARVLSGLGPTAVVHQRFTSEAESDASAGFPHPR
ncbi:hypothetical protein ACFVT9_35670 [Kitasatospora cineracea]|uniref:hypothetical protein n=1 Tax=Kitasatospora cineracea TaxID=88074 RepID=UPI0036DA472C